MFKRLIFTIVSIISIIVINNGCSNDFKFDIPKDKLNLVNQSLVRWDIILREIDSQNCLLKVNDLQKKYPDLIYTLKYIVWPDLARLDSGFASKIIYKYYHEPYADTLYNDVYKRFPTCRLDSINKQINLGFSRIKYFSPKTKIPKVATVVTLFAAQSFFTDSTIAIGLDCYLGSQYKYYNAAQLNLPQFVISKFESIYLVNQCFKTLFEYNYDFKSKKGLLGIDYFVQAGKRLYFAKIAQPDVQDSVLFEHSNVQIKWCQDAEAQLWQSLVASGVFFKSDAVQINNYLTEGPFTNAEGLPQETPSRIGEWIGYQIVKKYMDENPKMTLQELLANTDSRQILMKSKYKPK